MNADRIKAIQSTTAYPESASVQRALCQVWNEVAQEVDTSTTPPLTGTWRHNNGIICCGSLRIAQESFDTDPAKGFKDCVLDWMVETLNKEVEKSQHLSTGGAE